MDPSSNNNRSNSQLLERFGYKIGKKIGVGSFSSVRLAYSNQRKCSVALKIIWKDRASILYQTYFLPREIDIVKSLQHPNIVKYYQSIETNRRFIIVMEYAEYGSLLDLMAKKKILSEPEACMYFHQLISALEFCHSSKVAHRDLKLENLLLVQEDCLKIGDFGFSRKCDDPTSIYSLTFCGSNAYISPEILHQQPYNPFCADVWACGVILFAMVFGDLPFDDSGSIRHLTKLVERGLVFPNQIEISVECKSLIQKIMTPEPIRPKVQSIFEDSWMIKNSNIKEEEEE
ncbi:testis-specific serine/threonine-protein kinase 4 [Contarinia nasturtii]|uniref:testis-specific serine/threonine-protein kinase 4 n=1 Tax=Contarinia nasturtii TaxID=265458 RepID=UPI0012D4629B|nr:testis-specific serine/threonine-protein kinase 4 [Contarinia nasturtii]